MKRRGVVLLRTRRKVLCVADTLMTPRDVAEWRRMGYGVALL